MDLRAHRTKTYAAGAIVDDDGIKTAFATSTSPVTVVPANFNGAVLGAGQDVLDLPRTITISRSNNANQFSVAPIVITGDRGGLRVTEALTPANDDGNDVLHGKQAFDRLVSIAFPLQGGAGGQFKIGVESICCPKGHPFCAVEMLASGDLAVQYGDGVDAPTDTIPVDVSVKALYEIAPTRILSGSMADGIVLYLE